MIEGMDKYLEKLSRLSDIEKDVFQSLDECGEFVRDDARLRVPVDTGDLRKSLEHTTEIRNGEIISTVHTNSDHAVYVEFGTGQVGAANHEGTSPDVSVSYTMEKWRGVIPGLVSETDSGIRYIAGQKAHPYLYPAIKDNETQLENKLKADIKKALEEKSR